MSTALTATRAARATWLLRRQYLHAFVAAACVGPFLSYVLSDAGWSPAMIGYAQAALTVGAVATAPAWGWLADHWRGNVARACLLLTGASAAFLALAVMVLSPPVTLAAVAVLGSASGSIEPLLTTHTLRDEAMASKLGATRSMGSLGWVLGLGLGGSFMALSSHAPVVFLIAGLAAVTAPTARAAASAGRPRAKPDAGSGAVRSRPPVREVLGVLSVTFPYILCTAALVYFTAGWAHHALGAGPLLSVAPLALSAALELPAFVLVDRLAGRLSPRLLAGSAYAPFGLACLGLSLHPTRAMLFSGQPLVALSFALWFVGQSRLMAQRVDRAQLASALTLVSTLGRGVAGPLSGIVGGALASAAGYPTLFAAMAALSVLGLARALVLRGSGH